MTPREWEQVDKSVGTCFKTPDGRIGRVVSVLKDGATLDFTDKEYYKAVRYSFYRCQQLRLPSEEIKNEKIPYSGMVYCSLTDKTYSGSAEAAQATGADVKRIREACNTGQPIMLYDHGQEVKVYFERIPQSMPCKTKDNVKILRVKTGEIYSSLAEASERLKLSKDTIKYACIGKTKLVRIKTNPSMVGEEFRFV